MAMLTRSCHGHLPQISKTVTLDDQHDILSCQSTLVSRRIAVIMKGSTMQDEIVWLRYWVPTLQSRQLSARLGHGMKRDSGPAITAFVST